MKSPFPGTDPYLEARWGDVHTRFLTYVSDELGPRLPRDLRARVEERVALISPDGDEHQLVPDVRVIHRPWLETGPPDDSSVVAVAEPLRVKVTQPIVEPYTERFLEIREIGQDGRVITVIGIISPTNKRPGAGRALYQQKQQELRESGVSLVEIDLQREGRRVFAVPDDAIPESHRTAYLICTHRGWTPDDYELYRASLREPLPTIAVPLREHEEDVALNLQSVFELCYSRGRYDDIDYSHDPLPPLDPKDAEWADQLLREKGLR